MKIAELKVTCSACPVQLEGTTDTGLFFYARARYDMATINVAESMSDAYNYNGALHLRCSFNIDGDGYATSNVEALTKLTHAFVEMCE